MRCQCMTSANRLPAALQEGRVKYILTMALNNLKGSLAFSSVHAAAVQPRRLVTWLQAAVKLAIPERSELAEIVSVLVKLRRPDADTHTPTEAPGMVSTAQFEEGAVQLRRQVCHSV
jgi:hypothetical protein